MDFYDNKPIYKQIVEYCQAQTGNGNWIPGERIPSTKELAVTLGVNTRTVMRAYDELAEAAIIFQRRGMGYYLADDAPDRILAFRRSQFLSITIPKVAREMKLLGLSTNDILPLLDNI